MRSWKIFGLLLPVKRKERKSSRAGCTLGAEGSIHTLAFILLVIFVDSKSRYNTHHLEKQ